jgi:glutathione S-transferase
MFMIRLHQFAPAWGQNASPFCLKLETYLRMTEIPFEIVLDTDLRNAPKGKMPYIEENGNKIADSNFIIDYLKDAYGEKLEAHLNRSELAIKVAMQRLIEENLYWAMVYSRWQVQENWEKTKVAFFEDFPPILRNIIPVVARKQTLKNLLGQGMGLHTPEEVYRIGKRDLTAISDFLADKPYMMGEEPTSLDATAYGLLANILWVPIESPLKNYAEKLANLSPYCQRVRSRFYDSQA